MTLGGNSAWEMKPGTVLGSGRFVLIEALGQGGMGVVWLAHDQRLDEDVALKLVPPEIRTDAGALEDLRRETLRNRKLSHPNIIRLHDLNEFPDEPPFISMEFVDGLTVAAFKAQQPQRLFTWEQVRPVMRQLCDALEYAHLEKVIHRDLKPANMMLDRRGRLKLADFGLAAVVSELTSRVSIKASTSGTPAYMSPQQMDGRTPRVTDDIYALGATLYELLTSKPPFYHGDIPHQVRNLPPDSLEQRLAELELSNAVPPFVSALILACLAKEPAERPQSAAAVADMLQLGGQSVTSFLAKDITERWVPEQPTTSGPPITTPPVTPTPTPAPSPAPQMEPVTPAVAVVQEPLPAPQKSSGMKWVLAGGVGLVLIGVLALVIKPKPQPDNPANRSAAVSGTDNTPAGDSGVVALFNGRNFDGWEKLGPDVWRVEDGGIRGRSTFSERSYLVSQQRATNFELSFDYKPVSNPTGDGNHGVFYRAVMPSRQGVAADGLAMPFGADGLNGVLLLCVTNNFDVSRLQHVEKLREDAWNRIVIRVQGEQVFQSINGMTTYEGEIPTAPGRRLGDQIAFEIWNSPPGGDRAVEIRNITLRRR